MNGEQTQKEVITTDRRFAVGEVCHLLWSGDWPDKPFCECTVTAGARLFRKSYKPNGSLAFLDYLFVLQYEVRDETGEEWSVCSCWLRKKRPPQNWESLCRLSELPAEVITCLIP